MSDEATALPSDADLEAQVRAQLAATDLATLSMKALVRQLSEHFGGTHIS